MLDLLILGALLAVLVIACLAWAIRSFATVSRPVTEKQARENAAPLTTAVVNPRSGIAGGEVDSGGR